MYRGESLVLLKKKTELIKIQFYIYSVVVYFVSFFFKLSSSMVDRAISSVFLNISKSIYHHYYKLCQTK